jgi:predicted Fe-S protein YdhL (DUF1289 family)
MGPGPYLVTVPKVKRSITTSEAGRLKWARMSEEEQRAHIARMVAAASAARTRRAQARQKRQAAAEPEPATA